MVDASPPPASLLPPDTTVWLVTDGKAGDLAPCRGLAEALGSTPVERRIAPRPPFSWLAPRGPADPRERALIPPWPNLAIATGRRAVPALRAIKRRSGNDTFTVFLRDPRIGTRAADLIWVPAHDRLRGANVIVTEAGPHRSRPPASPRREPIPIRASPPSPRPASPCWSAATAGTGVFRRRMRRASSPDWSACRRARA